MNTAIKKVKWRIRRDLITAGLEVAALASRVRALRPNVRSGMIFTMHHVRPKPVQKAFDPNAHLEITPEFLNLAIETLKSEGFEFIRLQDLPQRLEEPKKQPFAILTLDDGYKNNRDHALAVFEAQNVPATIFVTKGFGERTAIIWWEVLVHLLERLTSIRFDLGDGEKVHSLSTADEKYEFFDRFTKVFWHRDELDFVGKLDAAARGNGIDPLQLTSDLTMSSEELAAISQHELIDLGAHTQRHLAIGRLDEETAREEISHSVEWVETLTGKKPKSFAFPYGNQISATNRDIQLVQSLGIELSVTTMPGMIRSDRITELSALPRVSLNGHYQKRRYVSALSSGVPFRW